MLNPSPLRQAIILVALSLFTPFVAQARPNLNLRPARQLATVKSPIVPSPSSPNLPDLSPVPQVDAVIPASINSKANKGEGPVSRHLANRQHRRHRRSNRDGTHLSTIDQANRSAMQEPRPDAYHNAIQIYPFSEGALYRLYATPDKVSDIELQAGERLIAISAGDTARWVIGDTSSGQGTDKRVHILVKPTLSPLSTNLVVTTDRRTYHLQLESMHGSSMAALSWSYPLDDLIIESASQARLESARTVATNLKLDRLDFAYEISGSQASWRPLRVFDDGQKTYIQFPETLSQSEAPPLFILGEKSDAQLVNYRVSKSYYIVDRLFERAELRLGGKYQLHVRLTHKGLRNLPSVQSKAASNLGGQND